MLCSGFIWFVISGHGAEGIGLGLGLIECAWFELSARRWDGQNFEVKCVGIGWVKSLWDVCEGVRVGKLRTCS